MLALVLLAGLGCLLLAMLGCIWLSNRVDRYQLDCFRLQPETRQRMDALTRATLAEMRRVARSQESQL